MPFSLTVIEKNKTFFFWWVISHKSCKEKNNVLQLLIHSWLNRYNIRVHSINKIYFLLSFSLSHLVQRDWYSFIDAYSSVLFKILQDILMQMKESYKKKSRTCPEMNSSIWVNILLFNFNKILHLKLQHKHTLNLLLQCF